MEGEGTDGERGRWEGGREREMVGGKDESKHATEGGARKCLQSPEPSGKTSFEIVRAPLYSGIAPLLCFIRKDK